MEALRAMPELTTLYNVKKFIGNHKKLSMPEQKTTSSHFGSRPRTDKQLLTHQTPLPQSRETESSYYCCLLSGNSNLTEDGEGNAIGNSFTSS